MAALRSALDTGTTSGFARLAGLSGALLTLVGLALTLLFWKLVPTGDSVSSRLERALELDVLLVPLALLGVLLSLRWPLLAAPILLSAFVSAFVFGFGWYFVLLPSPLAMIGAGGLLYGVAAVLMVVASIRQTPRDGAGPEERR